MPNQEPQGIESGKLSSDKISKTTEQILAEGDIQVQILAIKWIGVVIFLLAFGGIVISFNCAETGKGVWQVVSPIILAAITGMLGFLAGEKSAKRKQ